MNVERRPLRPLRGADVRRRRHRARLLRDAARRRRHHVDVRRRHHARHPARLSRDGQGDRVADGDRDGPPRRDRRDPPQSRDRRPSRRSAEGEAQPERDDHRPRHLAAERLAARGRGADAPVQVLRRADHRRRRTSGRHPHQPRHPLLRGCRLRSHGRRVHDGGGPRDGRGRHDARRGEGDPPASPHREAARSSTAPGGCRD